ncbi:MAG TPA: TIGR04283 family arsenosugar biosynthesis glycosyltransferase [Pyrinomonadaceae bacterium]|nr:TIGR04283 family arsenosugar biosynthesis glycosyltransferase [Pyrinomonadaceae bacterium]
MSSTQPAERPSVSIIIPTLNEERSIGAMLEAVGRVRGCVEVIVVDAASADLTAELARQSGARVMTSERGRGLQMHKGACAARGEVLLFLHADTFVPPDAAEEIIAALARDAEAIGGNCHVRFDGDRHAARFLTWLYPQLRRLGLCYGDSAIFVRAAVYKQLGGFQPFPIFEDVDFVRRLKRRGRMIHLPVSVVTSSRRFEGRSFTLTFTRWAILQGLYWLGVHPRVLNRLYAPVRSARVRN